MEWIKSIERMPEDRTRVLAYHPDWGVDISYYRAYGDEKIPIGLNDDRAIYWMPLPCPPKG